MGRALGSKPMDYRCPVSDLCLRQNICISKLLTVYLNRNCYRSSTYHHRNTNADLFDRDVFSFSPSRWVVPEILLALRGRIPYLSYRIQTKGNENKPQYDLLPICARTPVANPKSKPPHINPICQKDVRHRLSFLGYWVRRQAFLHPKAARTEIRVLP